MADKFQRAHLFAQPDRIRIANIPNRHAIGDHSQCVMVRSHRNTPDHAAVLHGLQTAHDLGLIQPQIIGNRIVGGGHQRQASLCRFNQAAVCGINAHAATRKPMKNSCSLGNCSTFRPVSASINSATSPIAAWVSVASTNHMFSLWSRS